MKKKVDYQLGKKSKKEKHKPIIAFAENLVSFSIPKLALNIASVLSEFFQVVKYNSRIVPVCYIHQV